MPRERRFLRLLVPVLAIAASGVLPPRDVGAGHNFGDVSNGAFYHAFVQFLVDNGITSGCGDGRFCGEAPVTRGQMAVFLKKLSDLVDQRLAANTAALQAPVTALEAQVTALQGQVTALQTALVGALGAIPCLRREGTEVIFEGCNVHIRSGGGATDAAVNGLGNLIVGYNEEDPPGGENRTGSHNLVVGMGHTNSSYGGFVAGVLNAVSGPHASVSGGVNNTASGNWASVSGGASNTAGGSFANVSGGIQNTASGTTASVTGGSQNTASGQSASVSGGNMGSAPNTDDWRAGALFQDN